MKYRLYSLDGGSVLGLWNPQFHYRVQKPSMHRLESVTSRTNQITIFNTNPYTDRPVPNSVYNFSDYNFTPATVKCEAMLQHSNSNSCKQSGKPQAV